MRKKNVASIIRFSFLFTVIAIWTSGDAAGKEDDWFIYLGDKSKKPKAPPKSISAAEALPPLPLPATPLRRTERKKPPQPDYLIGKVIWGQAASFTDSAVGKLDIADWNLCPTDIGRLMDSGRKMRLPYHWNNVNLSDFHYDPKRLPALLFSGGRTLRLSDEQIQALRDYVLEGGTIVCDSIAGSPYFYESSKSAFQNAFPECRIYKIPPDHPLYHVITDVEKVSYSSNVKGDKPYLEGIYIGSRIGVLFCRYGLGCGWNGNVQRVSRLSEAAYYEVKSAREIGLNLVAYIVGYADVGAVEGNPEVFGLADRKAVSDEFVFAQITHEGAWNVHPGAATALLMKMRRHSAVRVNLNRKAIDLEKDDLASYPFLYLTGLDGFSLSSKEVAVLRHYLHHEGVMLVNNGLGLGTFDGAVRRELMKVLPGAKFQKLGSNHPLYSSFFRIKKARYAPGVAEVDSKVGDKPYLLGIIIAGDLRVIYSPYDLEAGWLDVDYPLIRGYEASSAQELGVNIITYVMTN